MSIDLRVFPNKFGGFRIPADGGYGQDPRGRWWLRLPGCDVQPVSSVDVVLGKNDTITVSGFILGGNWWRATT